jgi:hypothetical protein
LRERECKQPVRHAHVPLLARQIDFRVAEAVADDPSERIDDVERATTEAVVAALREIA